jgi:hypothetical protein
MVDADFTDMTESLLMVDLLQDAVESLLVPSLNFPALGAGRTREVHRHQRVANRVAERIAI